MLTGNNAQNAMVDFKTKIKTARPTPSSEFEDDLLRAFESDRGRIINSAAIRRLQQKTQVFPLERNAAVRSRLTHSLEVQQTGRFISQQIFRELAEETAIYGLESLQREFETLVEMACLMHDMGNPPFGHFGEAAISEWFAQNLSTFPAFGENSSNRAQLLARELSNFEGNAQAIRLIANIQTLNLTYSQAACVLKYTRAASDLAPSKGQPFYNLQKKPGYFESEASYVHALQKELDMKPGHRFPLTYVMEAADDISYCLADIEDGVDKGLMTLDRLTFLLTEAYAQQQGNHATKPCFGGNTFQQVVEDVLEESKQEPISKSHAFFIKLRVKLIYPLVHHAARQFKDHIGEIYEGSFDRALLEDNSPEHAVIRSLKKVAREHIFCAPEVETLELQGYRIISGVLEHYAPLLRMSSEAFKALCEMGGKKPLIESRLFNRLPKKQVKAYQLMSGQEHPEPELWESYCRCRLIQDMVSGMTDQFALDEYQTLSAGSI